MPDKVSRQAGGLRSFRLVCSPDQVPFVEALLRAQSFDFETEPFFPLARKLTREPLPLGSSLAALFGYIYIQDRSSMLPPLALAPRKGAAVLDMCASPGSKTGLLGQLVGPEGFVLGNEPGKARLATLRRNLQLLNLLCCCTASFPGEALPLAEGAWEYIQLDPPCSGWGTVEKNPQVLRLWQGDKIRPLIALQRRLLAEAARLLAPGGRLVYSTCTTNTEENEDQIRYAQEELGLLFVPLSEPAGFSFADPARPEFTGALRVDTGRGGQGFFIALLQKPASAPVETKLPLPVACRPDQTGAHQTGLAAASRTESLKHGFFVRPWEKESRFVGERSRYGERGRSGRKRQGHATGAAAEYLPLAALESAYAEPALLPPGDIAVFNGIAHFLPAARRDRITEKTAWKGFVLGKMGKQGDVRLNPHLRALMPEAQAAEERAWPLINLEDIALLLPLIQGQGLGLKGGSARGAQSSEAGLYYRGLPLCRLTIKGRRAMLPPG